MSFRKDYKSDALTGGLEIQKYILYVNNIYIYIYKYI